MAAQRLHLQLSHGWGNSGSVPCMQVEGVRTTRMREEPQPCVEAAAPPPGRGRSGQVLRQQPLPQFRVFLFVLTVDNFKMTALGAVNTFANPTCCYLSASLHMPVSLPSFLSFQLVPFHLVTVAQGRLLLPHRVCVLRSYTQGCCSRSSTVLFQ